MGTEQLEWSGSDWRMPVWLWVGLATMFVSTLHIILDFGVGATAEVLPVQGSSAPAGRR